MPAYAATIGEVGEVKREKAAFFGGQSRTGEAAGLEVEMDVGRGTPPIVK